MLTSFLYALAVVFAICAALLAWSGAFQPALFFVVVSLLWIAVGDAWRREP